jgi:hypothetical protein
MPRHHMIASALTVTQAPRMKSTYFATRTGVGSFAIHRHRSSIRSTASSALPFASLALIILDDWCRRKIANRRQPPVIRRSHSDLLGHHWTSVHRLTTSIRHHSLLLCLLPSLCLCLCGRCRLWQELLEVAQKIGRSLEEVGDLAVHVLDRFRLALVGLQNL